MRKKLTSIFKNETHLMFAIRREQFHNGNEKLTPVVKRRGVFESWTPIVKINNEFEASHIHNTYEYTEKDCIEFINGYKKQIDYERSRKLNKIVYEEII